MERMEACDVEWKDVHSNTQFVDELNSDLEQVRKRLHVIDEHGIPHIGFDAFLILWQHSPHEEWKAKLLGLPYPGGALLSQLAEQGDPRRFTLPRPMLRSGDFEMSFSGLKTAVLTLVRQQEALSPTGQLDDRTRADICRAFQEAIVEVLVTKSLAALKHTGMARLVVAGGVGANRQLRAALDAAALKRQFEVFYPPLSLCTDNGAMIACAGAARLTEARPAGSFCARPRWALGSLPPVVSAT